MARYLKDKFDTDFLLNLNEIKHYCYFIPQIGYLDSGKNVKLCKSCTKGMFLGVNGLCIMMAVCTLCLAVVDTRILQQYGEEHATGSFIGDLIIIFICLVLMGIAIFGCVGAIKDNITMIYLYVGLVMILVALQLLLTVYVAVQRYGLEFRVVDWLREDFYRNTTGEVKQLHEKLWDDLQMTYECCGLNGPDDYPAILQDISMSCCPRAFRATTAFAKQMQYSNCINTETYFKDGCEDEILYMLQADGDYLIAIAVFAFLIETLSMLLAMSVANGLKYSVQVYKKTVRY